MTRSSRFVSIHEMTAILSSRLEGIELLVFSDLIQEMGINEIAQTRGLHPQTVRKIRAHIATEASLLGFEPTKSVF